MIYYINLDIYQKLFVQLKYEQHQVLLTLRRLLPTSKFCHLHSFTWISRTARFERRESFTA